VRSVLRRFSGGAEMNGPPRDESRTGRTGRSPRLCRGILGRLLAWRRTPTPCGGTLRDTRPAKGRRRRRLPTDCKD
jgi:hypothetical protein